MKTNPRPYLLVLFCGLLALLLGLSPAVYADTAYGESNVITVDTRGTVTATSISVTGRVLGKQTRTPLAGATVTLAGNSATTDASGAYSLANVNLSGGSTLQTSLAGYLTQSQTVTAATGARSVAMPDVLLTSSAVAGSKPVVESLTVSPDGTLVRGFNISALAIANINWNGNTPGPVSFYANDALVGTQTGSGPKYSSLVDIDSNFSPSSTPRKIKVIATSGGGASSDPATAPVRVIAAPSFLSGLMSYIVTGPGSAYVDFDLPLHEQKITLPVIGTFGWDFALSSSFDYTFGDGSWEWGFGVSADGNQHKAGRRPKIPGFARYKKPHLYLGNKEIEASLNGFLAGTADLTNGIKTQDMGVTLSLDTKLELTRYGLFDLVGPGLTNFLSSLGAGQQLKSVSLLLYATPSIAGSLTSAAQWPPDIKDASVTGGVGLEVAYEPKVNEDIGGRIYLGGKPTVTFGLPEPVFRDVNFKVTLGIEADLWWLSFKRDWPLISWPDANRRLPVGAIDMGNGYYVLESGGDATWQPMNRPWLNAGSEQFLPTTTGAARRLSVDATAALDLFNRMGQAAAPGAVYIPASGPSRRIASDPNLPAQASLPLIGNLFPQSSPSLAASGSTLMIAYVSDTGTSNTYQFTNVAYTYYNGTAWSTPTTIASAPNAQFLPKVLFDGDGNAIAVWEQVKDAAFTSTDVEAVGAQMEIMWSKWNPATQTWSPAAALTNNNYLDRAPQLTGPMANGDLILTWVQNEANHLMGSGVVGTVDNSRVMTVRWSKAAGTWSAPSVLVANLVGDLSYSLAASGNKAVFLWSKDMDGNLDDPSDSELFYRIWDETADAWGPETRYTNDTVADQYAKVTMDGASNIYLVWKRGNDLVMDKDFSGSPVAVRSDSTTAGFSDFALTVGPGGNVIVIWQEMTAEGTDAHYRVYDPASNSWGLDTMLSNDADLEKSFSPVWDSVGNLVLAYNNVAMSLTSKTVALDSGGSITVDGVPTPGQVDLLVARRALVQDLSLGANSLTATGTTFQAGDTITLNAIVANSGNVAVQNVQVGFYDGDPNNGGTLLQTVTLPDWLVASGSQTATTTWTIPSPVAAHTVYAVVDPAGQVTESDETNNTQSLALNGVDLELTYISGSVAQDGSVHVVAQVKNIGAPASPVTMLKLWPKDNPGATPLATTDVSLLNPGESVQVALDLPVGSQAEGDASYRLTVDEDKLSGDIDTSNNATFFSLNLFISTANDGIPDWWKRQYGFSVSDPNVAAADADGDGLTNYQEYLCGTDPNDSSSRLKIGQMNVLMQPDGKSGQFTISWVPAANMFYTVERSFDLQTWTAVVTHIQATTPLNSYTDTVTLPTGGNRCFYRVRVE